MPRYRHLIIVSAALLLGANLSASADTYRWTDENGNSVFSDRNSNTSAKTTKPANNVNYYSAPEQKAGQTTDSNKASSLATLEALPDNSEEKDHNQPLTEAQCQKQYLRSCDEVVNWEKYARQACTNDSRCEDSAYLERKYRPRTTEELNKIARRAGVRKNNFEDNLELFLKKKYTSFCEDRAERACQNSKLDNCEAKVEHQCKGRDSLEQMLSQYDGLSRNEKQQIIDKAKQMALENGYSSYNYEEVIGNLIEILMTQAMLGL